MADTFKADLDAAIATLEAAHDDVVAKQTANDAATAAASAASQALQDAQTAKTAALSAVNAVLANA